VFIALRPAALLAGEVGRDIRRANRLTTMSVAELSAHATLLTGGVLLEDLERVAYIVRGMGMVWLFTATRKLDVQQVLRATGLAKAPGRSMHDSRLYSLPGADDLCLAFVSERSFLRGSRQDVEGILAAAHPPTDRPVPVFPEPLMRALQTADRCHLLAVVGNPEAERGIGVDPADIVPSAEIARTLKELSSVQVSLRFDREFELQAQGTFKSEKAAREARKLLETGRDRLVPQLDELGEVLAERFAVFGGPGLAREVLGFYQASGPALRDLRIRSKGSALEVGLKLPGRGAFWALGMLAAPVTRVTHIEDPSELPPETRLELLRKGLPGEKPPE
jgi:hypothetical protein